uniref:Multidrug and toxin extrusion protein n=1 Tax=Mastacembelus armatus TaxID=205130 RepID=A0A3Q3SR67_9TELE
CDLSPPNSKLFCYACMRRWLPPVYIEELYHVLRLTGPLLLSRILNFLLPFVTTIFTGHIGNTELAGYALASATINVTTTATGYGLAVACDTLISQTFGGKNLKRVGVILQRSSLIMLLFCLPCWSLLMNSHNLLLIIYTIIIRFLLKLGVIGSAIANSLSQVSICLLLFGYIRWKKLHQQTWGGWSTDCLQEWGSYMKLAIPSVFMVCFEWWIWEVGGFLAGILGEEDLGAQHVLVEIGTITYMFPLGIQAAACVRVGNALGAGNTSRAIVTSKVALVLSGVLAVFQGIVIASFSQHIFLCTFIPLQWKSSSCVCSGILVGSGMQKIAAFSNLVNYYCIGLPVGIALMFAAQLRILGLWLGILICVFLEVGFFLILIYKLNWKKVTIKVGATHTDYLCSLKAEMDSEEVPKADGYSPANTQDQELTASHEAEGNDTNAEGSVGDAEQSNDTSNTKPQRLLSVTQLILRRGLTMLVLVLILALGVGFHIAFPPPEPSAQSRANFTLTWANDSTPIPLTPLDFTPNL